MRIETERLIIRPFIETDLPAFEELLRMPELPGWNMQLPRSAEFLKWHIDSAARMDIARGVVCMGLFEKSTGNLVGAAGAGEHDDLHEPEIFYSIAPDSRNNGYASEACAAVTEWALSTFDIPYIIGTVSTDNPASQRVLEKCGYEAINEQHLLVHVTGESYDFRYYRKYRK